jgi:hypothetical protein
MMKVCPQTNTECLDLASLIPKNDSVFYDDVHFIEVGARLVAEDIVTYLLSKPPFQPPSDGNSIYSATTMSR